MAATPVMMGYRGGNLEAAPDGTILLHRGPTSITKAELTVTEVLDKYEIQYLIKYRMRDVQDSRDAGAWWGPAKPVSWLDLSRRRGTWDHRMLGRAYLEEKKKKSKPKKTKGNSEATSWL